MSMEDDAALSIAKALLQTKDEVPEKNLARMLGVTIFEMKPKYTGLISTSLLDSDGYRIANKYEKPCDEHFNSRQMAGVDIIKASKDSDFCDSDLNALLSHYNRIHWVTSAENNTLSPIQNDKKGYKTKHLPWQEQYNIAGVTLVKDKGISPSYYWKKYTIEGKEYINIAEASIATGVSWDDIRKRCSAKSKIWVEWKWEIQARPGRPI